MRIALTGNPNSGKTTMYNALTGKSEKVGNWAGVTVDKKESSIKKSYYDGEEVKYFATKDGIAKIIDFEGMAKEELFEFPEGYTVAEQAEK